MSDESLQQLSALIDGRLEGDDSRSIIGEAIDDKELRATWTRYHLIGEGLRWNLPHAIDPDFARRVSLALENEPAILAPKRRRASWLASVVGVAMAASVAAMAVLIIEQLGIDAGEGAQQPLVLGPAMTTLNPLPIATVRWRTTERSPAPERLHSYLVNHSQYTSNFGMEGVSPYFRIVGYAANQNQ